MGKGYPRNNSIFGDSAEFYVGSLFCLMKHPNGNLRPDLVSWNGRYDPRFSLEVKSSSSPKGIMNSYQFHYGFTTEEDYRVLFGEDLGGSSEGDLSLLERGAVRLSYFDQPVAYYYNVVHRLSSLGDGDISFRFTDLKIDWGDQHIVPHMFSFAAYVAADSLRTKKSPEKCREDLLEVVRGNILKGCSNHADVRRTGRSWQDLNVNDILAVFNEDLSLTTRKGQRRLEIIRDFYPIYDSLRRVTIDGPNGTKIYALVEPQHFDLFDVQVRATVDERMEILEEVFRERRDALGLVEKYKARRFGKDLFGSKVRLEGQILTKEELELLKRLSEFRGKGDNPHLFNQAVPRGLSDLILRKT